MKIHLISIGKGMTSWVKQGFEEYTKRMPKDFEILLHEVAAMKRNDNANLEKIKQQESEHLLEKIPKDCVAIALDPQGKIVSTEALAKQLQHFHDMHQDIALLIGGPEGLSESCLAKVSQKWSLSALTFPHAVVRVIMAEQIYRAMTILKGLPYHR